MILDLILTVAILGILSIPGVFCYAAMFPQEKREDQVINGTAWGLAMTVVLIHICSHVHLMLFGAPWCMAAAVLGYNWFRSRTPMSKACRQRKQIWGILAGLAVVIIISRSIPLIMYELPRGYDPKFNMILADKALQLQRSFSNWQPFYDVQLNYPIGSHLLTACIATIARIEIHRVYGFMVPIFGALLAAQLFVLARRATRSPLLAVWASLLFGLVAVYGSIGYGFWNGLPNLMAMNFLLLSLSFLIRNPFTRRHIVAFGLCFVAIFLTHHHVMIAACAIYLGLFILFLSTKAERPKAWGMVASGIVALVTGGIYIIPYAIKVTKLSSTSVMRFKEPYFGWKLITESLGYGFTAAVVVGLAFYAYRAITKQQRLSSGWRFIFVVTGVLLSLFVGFSHIYRAYAKARYGHDWVAFTPSRFLTNVTVFLAIFAAYGLVVLVKKFRVHWGLQAAVLVAVAASNYGVWKRLAKRPDLPSPAMQQAYKWVRSNTPKDALILTTEQWAPYCARRRTMHFPLPVSEQAKTLPEYTTTVNRKLGNPLKQPPLGYPLLAIGDPQRFKLPHKVLWTHEPGLAVVEVLLPEIQGKK